MLKLILIFITYFTFCIQVNSTEKKVVVKKKVDEFIITNLDIKREIKYIASLSPGLFEKTDKKEILIYAERALVNETIKHIELSKFFNMDDINSIPDAVVNNFYKKLGFSSLKQFKEYLNINDLDYNLVLEKLYLEHLWNTLIYKKYNKKVNINKEKIKNKLKKQIDSQKKLTNFNLSEIIFTIKNKSELNDKYNKIKFSIEEMGFEDTAKLHSVSESGKFGGQLGWISESQLSSKILKEIENVAVENFTQPIKIADGYMILFVKEKKIEENKVDLDKALSRAVAYEKNKQLNEFSRLHFKKLAVNIKIE